MNQIKTLFSLFSKLDYRDKNNSGKKKMAGIMIAYLFSNSILSYNFHFIFDEKSYVILTFTSCLFMSAFIVLNDFENLWSFKYSSGQKQKSFHSEISISSYLYFIFYCLFCSATDNYFLFFRTQFNQRNSVCIYKPDVLFLCVKHSYTFLYRYTETFSG